MMEENKLSSSELEKLTKIYNKLDEIDSELFYMSNEFPKFILNSVRDRIIISMEKLKKYYMKIKNNIIIMKN